MGVRNRASRGALLYGSTFSILFLVLSSGFSRAPDLPNGFEQTLYVDKLRTPSTMEFGPNGRLLVAERVAGTIRLIRKDGTIRLEPVVALDIPRTEEGKLPGGRGYLSSGTRDFAFDPNFPEDPYLYVFYMQNKPRHNCVSRFRMKTDPLRASPDSEKKLIEVPFADDRSSGSHNGGAMVFGTDGKLYFTTGDGWNGGDPVQSLKTFTGKAFRINTDGSIPTDNPFYDTTEGPLRAIYALGFRNPFSMSRHPKTGQIFINDCGGPRKANIYKLEAGANYRYSRAGGHDISDWQSDFPGESHDPFANAGRGRFARLVTGGCWYPEDGSFPKACRGSYFIALWGSNGAIPGAINRMKSHTDPAMEVFAAPLDGAPDPENNMAWLSSARKPAYTKIGPDGALYWLSTTYRTPNGRVYKISYQDYD